MKVFYSPDYAGSAHAFATTRKSGWIADSLATEPIDSVELIAPTPLTADQIAMVHDDIYVSAVRTGSPRFLAESQGFGWDQGLWPMVAASTGGVVDAARAAMCDGVAGSLSSGLHHAYRDRGTGFCTFNGLAIAAKAVIDEGTAKSVLVLDLDAHCGGGTSSLIARDSRIRQIDVSVDSFDSYADTDNAQLTIVTDASEYLNACRQALSRTESATQSAKFDLCLYNAGMDPFQDCPIGGLDGITGEILARREALVFDWFRQRGIPVAFVLAGGYLGPNLDETGLVGLHRLTLTAAAQAAVTVTTWLGQRQ
ncbi:hypothetical protein [Antrihabitans stalactiti]|uniref:Histone deacetylase domain-containing protein n=1 Tax=Antrihabitans stalactiti TaxID=2584121 RepID=A0A848KJ52_9NOCA|nr:hypothetical protein [Antrihabitans stalactiti]NMN97838.1 hypothetical protein [Antrihabitans stalactiti]